MENQVNKDGNKQQAEPMADNDTIKVTVNKAGENSQEDDVKQAQSHDDTEQDEKVRQLENERDDLQKQIDQAKDKYVRVVADMENLRRRTEKEKADLFKFGHEEIMKDLLSVIDSFDKACPEGDLDESVSVASYAEGVRMTRKQLLDVLEKHGLVEVRSQGAFDPNIHQAITRIESTEVKEDTVQQVFAKGYSLNERLIRPAMVSVEVPSSQKED